MNWKQGPYYKEDVWDGEGGLVCSCNPFNAPIARQRAAKIVHAVNHHEELIRAVELLLQGYVPINLTDKIIRDDAVDLILKIQREKP